MKKAIIVLTILALAFLLGWRVVQTQKLRREALQKPQAEKTIAVGVMPVERREIRESIKASGNIQALAEITVFSKVSGKIARNQAAMGDVIRPGSLLAVVNRDEIGYDFKPYEVLSEVRGVVARVLQNPGATINPQIPLMTVVQIDTVKMVAAVDEKQIRFVTPGKSATVTLEAYPGERFPARVSVVSPVADAKTRTVETEFLLANARHRLKPGMYAEVEMEEGRRDALMVPITAVIDKGGKKFVFCAEGDRAAAVEVQTGTVVDDRIEIRMGLAAGRLVIVAGADKLSDRDRIVVTGK